MQEGEIEEAICRSYALLLPQLHADGLRISYDNRASLAVDWTSSFRAPMGAMLLLN